MDTPQIERLRSYLPKLKLQNTAINLDSLLQDASREELAYSDFWDRMLQNELGYKSEKQISMHLNMAKLPFKKTIETFDFDFQPSLDKKKIHELASNAYIERAENIILLGPPGTGKTHLAVAFGIKAIQQGYRPLFCQAATLVASLTKAYAENRS